MQMLLLLWSSKQELLGIHTSTELLEMAIEDIKHEHDTVGVQEVMPNDYAENGIYEESEVDWRTT